MVFESIHHWCAQVPSYGESLMVTVRDLGLDKKARFCRLHSFFFVIWKSSGGSFKKTSWAAIGWDIFFKRSCWSSGAEFSGYLLWPRLNLLHCRVVDLGMLSGELFDRWYRSGRCLSFERFGGSFIICNLWGHHSVGILGGDLILTATPECRDKYATKCTPQHPNNGSFPKMLYTNDVDEIFDLLEMVHHLEEAPLWVKVSLCWNAH